MPAMIDVSCACGKRFGWCGRFADRPKCPRCGARPSQESLEETDRRMDADRALFDTHPQRATLEQLREQRVKAGLTGRRAAKALGIEPRLLCDIEHGRAPLPTELAAKMAEAYGISNGA